MAGIKDELTALETKEKRIVDNKVANFAYEDEAYTDEAHYADSVSSYDFDSPQNIPKAQADILQVNSTVLLKGFRSQASSVTRMLLNHFFGRTSYNLNKINDNVYTLIQKLKGAVGTANGLATLDASAHLPVSQLPSAVVQKVNGVSPVSGDVKNVLVKSRTDYNSMPLNDKKGKLFLVENVDTTQQIDINDNTTATDSAWSSSKTSDILSKHEQSLVFNNTQSSATYKGYWNEIFIDFGANISIPSQDNYNYCSMKVSLFGARGQAVYNVQFNQELVNIVCLSKSDPDMKLYGTYQNNKLYLLPLTTWGAFMYITDIKANKVVSVSGARFDSTLYTGITTKPSAFTNEIVSEITDKVLDNTINNALTDYWNGDVSAKTNYTGNLNNITSGMYTVSSVAQNTPNGKFGFLTSIFRSEDYQVQYYEVIETKETFRRIRHNKTWESWEKVVTEKNVFNLSSYAYNKVHEYIKDNWNDIPIGQSKYNLSTNATGTANYTSCDITKQSNTLGEVLVHSYYNDLIMINYNGVWSIRKIVTETI